jgi:hypothetical protein
MSNINAYVKTMMVQYPNTATTVSQVLDHLFFTIGNGLGYKDGMFYYDGCRIDDFRIMPDDECQQLLDKMKQEMVATITERFGFVQQDLLDEIIEDNTAVYNDLPVVNDDSFSEESMVDDIIALSDLYKAKYNGAELYRPYPLSEKYAYIYKLDAKTPTWLVRIAINFCKAWVRVLNMEISIGSYSTEEHNYSNKAYTVKHRDMLAKQLQVLERLIQHEQKV